MVVVNKNKIQLFKDHGCCIIVALAIHCCSLVLWLCGVAKKSSRQR